MARIHTLMKGHLNSSHNKMQVKKLCLNHFEMKVFKCCVFSSSGPGINPIICVGEHCVLCKPLLNAFCNTTQYPINLPKVKRKKKHGVSCLLSTALSK